MEQAQLLLMGRLLTAARNEARNGHGKKMSRSEVAERLGVDPATVARWERGEVKPQPDHVYALCDLFQKTAEELGLGEVNEKRYPESTSSVTIAGVQLHIPARNMSFLAFLEQDLTLRLESVIDKWSHRKNRDQTLQELIILEIEDNIIMNPDDSLSRRDAFYRLALVPLKISGLSACTVIYKKSYEEVLTQCSAGITACWYLRRGKELYFADDVVSSYLPTLMSIVETSSTHERKAAADLVSQCFLLKTALASKVTTPLDGIGYAQQAVTYSKEAENPLLEMVSLRAEAAMRGYVNQWGEALKLGLEAKRVLATMPKELVPPLARSHLYTGLSKYQAHTGRKEDALASLSKAYAAFHAQPTNQVVPLWIDHSIGNLLLNDGLTHGQLEMYQQAGDAFQKVEEEHKNDPTVPFACRVEVWLEQAMNEASREDQSPNMRQCIDLWIKGVEGAQMVESKKHLSDAHIAYRIMRAVWSKEKAVRDLRDYLT